jgi:flagellar biosynthesis/type III secretory pathway M-ring protein FliF/YscJ
MDKKDKAVEEMMSNIHEEMLTYLEEGKDIFEIGAAYLGMARWIYVTALGREQAAEVFKDAVNANSVVLMQQLNAVKALVAEDPGRVAQVIKRWINEE